MPNTLHKTKANQVLPMEREKNKKRNARLPAQQKMLATADAAKKKKETVWDRLSKAKKLYSENDEIVAKRQRGVLNADMENDMNHTAHAPTKGRGRKRFTESAAIINTRHSLNNKSPIRIQMHKAVFMPQENSQKLLISCQPIKSARDLVTPRSVVNSKSSQDSKRGSRSSSPSTGRCSFASENEMMSPSMHLPDLEDSDMQDDSVSDYIVPPLMPMPGSTTRSEMLNNKYQYLLNHKEYKMQPDELNIIKNMMRMDVAHYDDGGGGGVVSNNMEDTRLFKHILKSQLKDIAQQETVIKSALDKLESEISTIGASLPEGSFAEMQMMQESSAYTENAIVKPQVDVVFKNVPSLEKEIVILKALGQKLEATLMRTASQRRLDIDELCGVALAPKLPKKHKIYEVAILQDKLTSAEIEIVPMGVALLVGLVQEFEIAHKTIVDLKKEANRKFYLPIKNNAAELKCTSFKKLSEDPDLLMQHLRPKSSLIPFNVLEQDPLLLNSFLFNISHFDADRISKDVDKKDVTVSHSCLSTRIPYSCEELKEPLKIEEITTSSHAFREIYKKPERKASLLSVCTLLQDEEELEVSSSDTEQFESSCEDDAVITTTEFCIMQQPAEPELLPDIKVATVANIKFVAEPVLEPASAAEPVMEPASVAEVVIEPATVPIRVVPSKRRRRIRKRTPLPMNRQPVELKNDLFKTILVGFMQMLLFLILIMAVTYPNIKC